MLALISSVCAENQKVVEVPADSFYVVSGVNIRNGNFAVTFSTSQDNNDPSGIPFNRVYNSFSEHQGSFGLGWGATMENSINFEEDGRLSIQENGTGGVSYYRFKEGGAGNEYVSFESNLRRRSISIDNYTREALRRKFVKRGAIPDTGPVEAKSLGPIPDGSVFIVENSFSGNVCSENSEIRRKGDSMFRIFSHDCPIASETYTLQGTLIHVESRLSRFGASLSISRDEKSHLITSITDEKGKVTRFKYDQRKRLIRQDYPNGDFESFEYDDRDNMTAIVYLDGSRKIISYDAKSRVISVMPRVGPRASFEYLKDPYDSRVSVTRATLSEGDQKSVTIFKILK